MTSPEPADLAILLDADRLAKRKAWEIDRARNERRRPPSDSGDNDYAPIEFPECKGLCHAASVVANSMVRSSEDLYGALEGTREILDALAIPHIMQHGGDGRTVKVQRGRVRFGDDEAQFSVEDADAKPAKRRNARKAKPSA